MSEFKSLAPYIQSARDLIDHFHSLNNSQNDRNIQKIKTGVFILGKVKREILVANQQGTITLNGKVAKIKFESMGDGVVREWIGLNSIGLHDV